MMSSNNNKKWYEEVPVILTRLQFTKKFSLLVNTFISLNTDGLTEL